MKFVGRQLSVVVGLNIFLLCPSLCRQGQSKNERSSMGGMTQLLGHFDWELMILLGDKIIIPCGLEQVSEGLVNL